MEVKEAGVVSVVGLFVEIAKPPIDVLAVEERLQLAIGFDAAVFANAQKDEPVDGALDGKVQLVDGERGIAQREVFGERFPPGFDLFKKFSIDRGRATLASVTAYLSNEPLRTASLVKMPAISSHRVR